MSEKDKDHRKQMVQINKIRSAKENQQPTPQICIGFLYAKKMNNLEKN